MKKQLCAIAFAVLTVPAGAASWDSGQNIATASNAALANFNAGHAPAMELADQDCYAGLDKSRRNPNLYKDVEYCVSLEIASLTIWQRIQDKTAVKSQYFDDSDALVLKWASLLQTTGAISEQSELRPYLQVRKQRVTAILDKSFPD